MTVVQAPPAEAVSAVSQPSPGATESGGVVAVVVDFVGATLPQFDRLLESMRLSPDGPGWAGSLFQWSRRTPDGVRVTEVWQSHDHFEAFRREELEPRLSKAGLREPEITTYEVHSYLSRGSAVTQQDGENGSSPSGSRHVESSLRRTDISLAFD
jgi:hypothetical protein